MDKSKEISFSQISSYKSCKFKWYYNNILRIESRRLRPTISFGSCGHKILEAHYRGKDIEEAAIKWQKDMVSSSEYWFEEEIEDMKVLADNALKSVKHYLLYHPEDRDWVVLDVEKEYKVVVEGMSGIVVHGFFDVVIRENKDSKNIWIVEHKFPTSLKSEDNLDLIQQLKMYDWAARKVYQKQGSVKGCIYNQILGKAPSEPTINKNGSMSRADIATTWEVYCDALIKAGLNPVDYMEMEEKLRQKTFWQRNKILTTDVERRNFVVDLKSVIWEMNKKGNHMFGAYSFICDGCEFRELCIEHLKGGDIEFIIENSYRKRQARK